jgi:dephospho-CoA kinase
MSRPRTWYPRLPAADVTMGDYRGRVRKIVIAGGIGAGKTAVTHRVAAQGFDVVDADVIAHQVTAPGRPAWRALRDAFGDAVLTPDGALDRAFVADVVFHDPSALRRLNHITHGHIGAEIVRQIEKATSGAVFIALPLFRPEHRELFQVDEVWAVLADPEVAVRRLCTHRGFTESDARARIANQMSNEERAAIVDRVIWNNGTLEQLDAHLDGLLREIGLTRG